MPQRACAAAYIQSERLLEKSPPASRDNPPEQRAGSAYFTLSISYLDIATEELIKFLKIDYGS
jgi:hypothetical protein